MSEHPNRDQIAELLASLTLPDEESWHEWRYETADALIAAGLVVPAGLTAENLRAAATELEHHRRRSCYPQPASGHVASLRGWATALGEG